MAERDREFDVVVWGATGFVGRLLSEYLLERYGAGSGREGAPVEGAPLRWALGGRSLHKLASLRNEIAGRVGVDASGLPLVVGDALDDASVAAVAKRTSVLCTTVGPYALYGSPMVATCAASGTHYCDLTGEVHWIRKMIDTHDDAAIRSGARIVPGCGFDSIPSDLGTYFMQRQMKARHGVPCSHVAMRVESFRGGMSGGTLASMLHLMEEAERDPDLRRLMADPYSLNPEGERGGPDGPDQTLPIYDPDFEQWTAPFLMAQINTRVVRRTNALLGRGYGADFRYDEAFLTGSGPLGWAAAMAVSAASAGGMAALGSGAIRRAVAGFLPAPGAGPSRATQEAGYWKLASYGRHPADRGKSLRGRLTGDRDPGYASTARMLGESAVCLAREDLTSPGGLLTPAVAMGDTLIRRLQAHAGITFSIEEG